MDFLEIRDFKILADIDQKPILDLIQSKIKETNLPAEEVNEKSDTISDNRPISDSEKAKIKNHLDELIFDNFAPAGTPKLPSAIKKAGDSALNFTDFAAA